MNGYHIVRRHYFSKNADTLTLPPGYKPFGNEMVGDVSIILTREWISLEPKAVDKRGR